MQNFKKIASQTDTQTDKNDSIGPFPVNNKHKLAVSYQETVVSNNITYKLIGMLPILLF